MIVIGYQGIGKTSLAKKYWNIIDLQSSLFFVDGMRPPHWQQIYCNLAEQLSGQGYIVFTSSHEIVRKKLLKTNERVFCIYPSLQLKDKWITKLHQRYIDQPTLKNKKAWLNAEDRYQLNIQEIKKSGIPGWEIPNMDYDFESMIDWLDKYNREGYNFEKHKWTNIHGNL